MGPGQSGRRSDAVTLMFALVAVLAGCPGGPIDLAPSYKLVFPDGKRWVTLQQGGSNPFLQRGNVGWYRKPLAFDKMDIEGKPVAVYLSRLSEDTRRKVEEDMRRAAAVFSEKLREEGEGITFLEAPARAALSWSLRCCPGTRESSGCSSRKRINP